MIKVYKGYKNNKIDIINTIKLNTPSWLIFTLETVAISAITYTLLIALQTALHLATTFIN